MFGTYFYHGIMKKMIIVFGNLFNNITIQRRDSNSNLIQYIKVPITYAPKEQYLAKLNVSENKRTLSFI